MEAGTCPVVSSVQGTDGLSTLVFRKKCTRWSSEREPARGVLYQSFNSLLVEVVPGSAQVLLFLEGRLGTIKEELQVLCSKIVMDKQR